MATRPDFRAQRVLRSNAFRGPSPLTEAELARDLERLAIYHAGPTYHAPTDLCVRSPDGRFVAGCEALLDIRNREADIERVCTHSDFRRRGLARSVVVECLHRLRVMGIERAAITGYGPGAVALYRSLGAAEEMTSYVYSRAQTA
ncbi:MAG: GNAT family N-acetyltransferase [Candidatus Bipolaricaulota bacterium]